MTRDDVKKTLGEGATEQQISAMLNLFHTEQKNLTDQVANLQGNVTKLTTEKTELMDYKSKYEAIEQANMTEQDQIAKLKKDAEAEMTKAKKYSNSLKAKSMLIGIGIEDSKATDIVNDIVDADESVTLAKAQRLVDQFTAVRDATAKKTAEDLANLDVKPNPSNIPPNSDKMTWEKYTTMSAAEQTKFAEEHPEEFNNL